MNWLNPFSWLQALWDAGEKKFKKELAQEKPEMIHEIICPKCGETAVTVRTRSQFKADTEK